MISACQCLSCSWPAVPFCMRNDLDRLCLALCSGFAAMAWISFVVLEGKFVEKFFLLELEIEFAARESMYVPLR